MILHLVRFVCCSITEVYIRYRSCIYVHWHIVEHLSLECWCLSDFGWNNHKWMNILIYGCMYVCILYIKLRQRKNIRIYYTHVCNDIGNFIICFFSSVMFTYSVHITQYMIFTNTFFFLITMQLIFFLLCRYLHVFGFCMDTNMQPKMSHSFIVYVYVVICNTSYSTQNELNDNCMWASESAMGSMSLSSLSEFDFICVVFCFVFFLFLFCVDASSASAFWLFNHQNHLACLVRLRPLVHDAK